MMDKVISLIKDNINIPKVLLTNYKKLKIEEKELVILIYIMNQDNNLFNPGLISEELSLTLPEVLESIEKLNEADLLSIDTNKNNGVIEEVMDLTNLYKKLAYLIVNEEKETPKESTIYDSFEAEFGRPLSPVELEIVNTWLDSEYSEELINCALKEAVYNGATSIRYIDKILFEWSKKGIKNKEDVLKDKQNFKKNKANKKIEWVDYDYLNEDE